MGTIGGTDPGMSLVELLTVGQRRAVQGLAAALAEDGCTIDQWRVLRALADGQGHTMGELSDSLVIAQPTLTRVMDSLADAGLVYRRQSRTDRRRVAVHLARQGRARLARLDAVVAAHEESLRGSPEWTQLQARVARALEHG